MNRLRRIMTLAIAACSILFAGSTLAQGDAAAGEAKAGVCAACHGIDGNSTVPTWPKLAGQHEQYLARQMRLIRDGQHEVLEMSGIVAGMTDQDFDDLAAYFASKPLTPGVADEALVPVGERIYRAGNAESGVPACTACHGPAGEGNPLSGYPALAGQHAAYTEKMLRGFRDGVTWGPEDVNSRIMADVAAELTDAEIQAVASYVQGLHYAGTSGSE